LTEWVERTEQVPPGAHAMALYGSSDEGERAVLGFVAGAERFAQPALWLTGMSDAERLRRCRAELDQRAPHGERTIVPLRGPQIRETPQGLRPLDDALAYAAAHPAGATLVGDTIPTYLTGDTLGGYLEYERWFDRLRPFPHRALCPYDLSRLPLLRAPAAIVGLALRHSHLVLSDDPRPAVRLLQLLVIPHLPNAPPVQRVAVDRAIDHRLLRRTGGEDVVGLTLRGEQLVRALRHRTAG
jgi:hypothetical protein